MRNSPAELGNVICMKLKIVTFHIFLNADQEKVEVQKVWCSQEEMCVGTASSQQSGAVQ